MKKLCAFLIFLASYGGLLAQYHATVTYSTRDGMLSSELSSVFVDSKGYVWTSSASGLSRFDGQSFRNFTVEDGLALNNVYSIREDAQGRIWCNHGESSYNSFFSVIEGERARPIPFTERYGFEATLEYNPYDKELWAVSRGAQGIWVYDPARDTFQLKYQNEEGTIYFFYSADPFRNRLLTIRNNPPSSRALVDLKKLENGKWEYIVDAPIYNINLLYAFGLPAGGILAVTLKGEWIQYHAESGWTPFIPENKQPDSFDFFDQPGIVQVKPTGRPSVWELIDISARYPLGLKFLFFSNHPITAGLETAKRAPDGTYWIASRNGLIHLFPAFVDCPIRENTWFLSDLHAIAEARDGRVWFGSYTYGFSLFDGKEVRQGPDFTAPYQKVLPGTLLDEKGDMMFWLEGDSSRSVNGLLRLDGESKADWIIRDTLGFFLTRAYDGQIGYGLAGHGLAISTPTPDCPGCKKILGPEKGMKLLNVITAVKDRFGRWWMGRPSAGLACYDPVLDTVFSYLRTDQKLDYGVMSSQMDSRGNLWFGTTHGLCFYPTTKDIDYASFRPREAFIPIGLEEMGPSQVNMLKILDEETLLAGNQQGIALIDLKSFYETGQARVYFFQEKDGYSGPGTEQNCVWVDRKGQVWIGSDAGAHRFNPKYFIRSDRPPAFEVDSLTFGNRAYLMPSVAGKRIRIKQSRYGANLAVFLTPQHDPVRPAHLFFSYKLSSDSTFSTPSKNRLIEFPNLAPGAYTLQVRAHKDGLVSEIREVRFRIPRSFWETPWPWLISAILLAAGYWFLQVNRNRQKMEKNKLQVQAIVNQLNPHFINNALQWVQIRVYKDQEAVSVISKLGENIRLVFKNSREKKAFHSLKEEMLLVENYLFIQKKRFGNQLEYQLPDASKLERFGQVQVPLMQVQIHCENAVEHGIRNKEDMGMVRIGLEGDADYLHITVEDDGIGRRRAGEIGSKGTQQGTKMLENLRDIFNKRNILPITYEYEDDIFLDSKGEGHGTRVHIRIPKSYRYEFD